MTEKTAPGVQANNASITIDGVPGNLTADFIRHWLRSRISEKRLKHTEGVANTARNFAERSSDSLQLAQMAEIAGWLHDCCKEVKDKQLIIDARNFGLKLHPVEELSGHILHGPVGACVVREELKLTNQEILDAITEHTLGAVNMTVLSKIVFLADGLEPSRSAEYTKPIWQALDSESADRGIDLDAAILVSCEMGLRDLLDAGRLIHPKTIDVRNYYLQIIQARSHGVS